MTEQQAFLNQLQSALDDIQAIDVVIIDVRKQTSVTDYMIVCSGRSSRHVRAVAEFVVEQMEAAGLPPLSQSGLENGEWVLIDFGDFVLHIMQAESRAFYNLEGLWQSNLTSE
ncbi:MULTISPECIES: ribosome silencing factor [Legionella]|uniref:Ribosomal silencing factor RsfS n=1 Tax=Legionella maceachernii TaxID=466 RepID=A0A0W0WE27_9GAMM|nr:ribosome silencing factor [Legionella maceachernii]KTD30628.1 Ribosomal silencing factor RsfS [Legionella maceachernii]SJZ81819.1 ribosome-associated protein [Legionella maceachernii]SUP02755.1 ribosome-associated protein [Legionella maceachernii]